MLTSTHKLSAGSKTNPLFSRPNRSGLPLLTGLSSAPDADGLMTWLSPTVLSGQHLDRSPPPWI